MKNMNINVWEAQWSPAKLNSERLTETHYNQTLRKTKKKNHKNSKRQVTHHIQGVLNKVVSRLLIRNFGGQKAKGQCIQSSGKKCQPRMVLKVREKLRHFQINKSWGNIFPLDLPCRKYSRELCEVKWEDPR